MFGSEARDGIAHVTMNKPDEKETGNAGTQGGHRPRRQGSGCYRARRANRWGTHPWPGRARLPLGCRWARNLPERGEQSGGARSIPTRRRRPLRHSDVLAGVRRGCTGTPPRDAHGGRRRTRHAQDRLDGFRDRSLRQRGRRGRRWRRGVAVSRRRRGAERDSPPLARGWECAGYRGCFHHRSPRRAVARRELAVSFAKRHLVVYETFTWAELENIAA